MILIPVLLPLVGGLSLLCFTPQNVKAYSVFLLGLTSCLMALVTLFYGEATTLAPFPFGLSFAMEIDGIGLFFSGVSLIVWWVVLLESFSFFDQPSPKFYAFYLALFSGVLGACYSDNLLSFYLFFELAGLLCIPLVAFDNTKSSIDASLSYLFYSLGGAFLGLISVIYFSSLPLAQGFSPGGISGLAEVVDPGKMLGFVFLAVIGFGCKAGLLPLHKGLILADSAAPCPGAAVLSGVMTKLGILAMVRLSYYVVGPSLIQGSSVQEGVLTLAMTTILMGSLLAYREKILKVRLAYSTVSQVGYIVLGLFLFQERAFVGAMLQVACHALAKALLFLCGGQLEKKSGKTTVEQLQRLAMNPSFVLFALASISLVGLPFTGGFVAKWYLGTGAMAQEMLAVPGVIVLILSAILTARYLFPLVVLPLFVAEEEDGEKKSGGESSFAPILALLLLGLGIYPLPLLDALYSIVANLF